MTELVSFELFGQNYTLNADAQVANAEQVASYFAQQVEKVQREAASTPGRLEAVMLAALNIANDYYELKSWRESFLRDLDQRCLDLMKRIHLDNQDRTKDG